ncbi:MAG: hypothetical protein ABR610_14920 [Thermoanaerobaculia bacterium]
MKLCPVCHRCFSDTTRVCVEPAHPALVEGPGIDLEIAGTWVLERLLAEHPSGGTFFARSRKTGETATVIVRRPPVLEDADAFELFVRESSLLAGLQEVSIAGVEEFGPLPFGGAYAVVEPAGDETLRELLDREGGLAVPLAASIGQQVALASEGLAQSGVPLGEISSDRIGLRRRDSGPAARLVRLPGSPLEGGASAEIPALGALLYEMLSGRRPATGGNNAVPPPPIQRARPDLPESLGWLVMQCLHPSAGARPRSAAEVARRLKPFEQLTAEPAGESPRAPAAKPARPIAAAAAVAPAPPDPLPVAAQIEPVSAAPVALAAPSAPPPVVELDTFDAAAAELSAPPPPSAPDLPAPTGELPVPAADPPGEAPDPALEQDEEEAAAPLAAAAAAIASLVSTDDDSPPSKPPPADSAITAEIPILRPRYSYRATPPPKKTEEQTGPRPMFLEPPAPAFVSFEDPPPPPPSESVRPRSPASSRSSFGASAGSLPSLWQPAAPPPAPPPASPPSAIARGARAAGSPSEVRRSKAGGSPPRQIPISAEPSDPPASADSSASRDRRRFPAAAGSGSGATVTPIGAVKNSGIDGVTIGEEGSPLFEPPKRGPRPGVVWGTAAAVAALIFGLFWFVIEATPARRAASSRVAARAVKPVEPPAPAATAQAAPSTAGPRSLGPQPAPAAPPVAAEVPAVAAPSRSDPAPVAASPRTGGRDAKPSVPAARRAPSRVAPPAAVAAGTSRHGGSGSGLRDALDAWIDSTNARDLSGHMRFYQPRVNTFYLQRNVSRDFVRREKARLFDGGPVSVAAGEPEIDPSPDGRTATVRFRKRYAVAGGQGEKRGEVLQEMQWIRTPEGWRIAGERDARVIAKQ